MKHTLFVFLIFLFSTVVYSQSKMSPATRQLLTYLKLQENPTSDPGGNRRNFIIRNREGQKYIRAFIHLSGTDHNCRALEKTGIKINSRFAEIITAEIPVNKLEEVAALDEVKYIETATPVYPAMDNARNTTKAGQVQSGLNLTQAFSGTGVVVGIVDMGFEYGHPNFYNYDQTDLRIKRVWNQGDETGTPPQGYEYGTELREKAEIIRAKYDTDERSHGTHVTGIAAGADTVGNPFYGIAGDADIVLVSCYDREENPYANASLTDGIKYIFDYAASVNKPCVVNLSLGSNIGPHDGTSTFDKINDSMQGEGRIIVGGAGNSADAKVHVSKTFNTGSNEPLSTFLHALCETDIWGDEGMKYSVQLLVYNANLNIVTKLYDELDASLQAGNEKTYSVEGIEGFISVITEISPLNGKPHVSIRPELNDIKGESFIGLTIRALTPGTVHAWTDSYAGGAFMSYNRAGFTDGDNRLSSGEIGGTGKRIISVGAYVSKDRFKRINSDKESVLNMQLGSITNFSSLGPTSDGRVKPDVTAPGAMVISSISAYTNPMTELFVSKKEWNGRTYYYGAMAGTSMAAPCVTGIIATWLQANPGLTPEDVRSILQKTSLQDEFTGKLPEVGDNTWGYGKINAWDGIRESLRMYTGIETETVKPVVCISDGGNRFRLLFTHPSAYTNISVFDLNGKKVCNQRIGQTYPGDEMPVSVEGADPGLYLIQITGERISFVAKMVLK